MSTSIIACGISTPAFESAKHGFYLILLLIKLFIMGNRLFPAVSARNARSDSFAKQGLAKPAGIIAPTRQEFPGLGQRVEQNGGTLVIAHLTIGQMKRYRLARGIANGMKF